MKKILSALILPLFLLTTASSVYYPPGGFDFEPTLPQLNICSCNPDCNPELCEVDGCTGTKECSAATCVIQNSGCADEDCNTTHTIHMSLCDFSRDTCKLGCFTQSCRDNCDDDYDVCIANCQDNFDECDACTGKWSSCVKDEPCCGVTCDDNEECDSGSCVCADTQERCLADGTGNGVDDDCDGDVDEGCAVCAEGETVACTEDGCNGVRTCDDDGEWDDCVKNNPCCGVTCDSNELCDASSGDCVCIDSVERCALDGTGDGVDNDCDGDVDEGCSEEPVDEGDEEGEGTEGEEGEGAEEGSEGEGTEGDDSEGEGNDAGEGTEGEGTSGQDTGGTGTTPPGGPGQPIIPTPPTSGSGLDMNLVMILVIIVVIGIITLAAIAMMKKKGGQAPPPQPAQPVVIQQ